MVTYSLATARGLKILVPGQTTSLRPPTTATQHIKPEEHGRNPFKLYTARRPWFSSCVTFLPCKAKHAKTQEIRISQGTHDLRDHIRKRRLELGLFQREVAVQIGVDAMTIWNWDCNESRPQIYHMPAIRRFLRYDPLPNRNP